MMNTLLLDRLQVKLRLLAFIASLAGFVLLFRVGLNDREHAIDHDRPYG